MADKKALSSVVRKAVQKELSSVEPKAALTAALRALNLVDLRADSLAGATVEQTAAMKAVSKAVSRARLMAA